MIKRIAKKILRPIINMVFQSKWGVVRMYRKKINSDRRKGINRKESSQFVFYRKDRVLQFDELFKKIKIELNPDKRFQFWIDENLHFFNRGQLTDALSPNYSLVLENSINDLIELYKNMPGIVAHNNYRLLLSVKEYVLKIIEEMNSPVYAKNSKIFENMLHAKASSVEDALQRILFWSSLFWQSGHCHIGIGRLDKLLAPYMGHLDDNLLSTMISDFVDELHRYYAFKSCGMMGDTGQIIILGGKELDGSYYANQVTYCCIKALTLHKLPDPKILLRVSRDMPSDLLALAIECNATGIGCPLLSNDDVVIPALQEFGYSKEDAFNYITSACWEPFCFGKALGRGNLAQINLAKVFESTYRNLDFVKHSSFDSLIEQFKKNIETEVKAQIKKIDCIRWDKNPLMSLFTKDCLETDKDVCEGGAIYNDYGVLTVGMANAINSLLNIKKLCFEERKLSLEKAKNILENNYTDEEFWRKEIYKNSFYAHEQESTIAIVKEFIDVVKGVCEEYRNYLGGKLKFGLSSFAYMDEGKNTNATFDGRKAGEPLSAHISSKLGEPYTELINFAGKLDYSGCKCNGNVVDFFVSPSFIQDNFEKFCSFILSAIKVGSFQMQMNVVSSATLIAARKNPELYPNLIVRVWGFSAYFKDLPDQYKDLLIKRALESEMAA